ncbi:hypothetical protein CERSUDRAFT_83446 [Gelatoporia subvermispora B]|uniref:Uncharacterized protein n=1 Tax=Ceriporiopsis subvermispora (strain B) TaxID=914234 RepID=M2QZP2_CERS8|nr:hypothetical protein CERSUDRAFT_83446 [Gelatoporia subvermispora B]
MAGDSSQRRSAGGRCLGGPTSSFALCDKPGRAEKSEISFAGDADLRTSFKAVSIVSASVKTSGLEGRIGPSDP